MYLSLLGLFIKMTAATLTQVNEEFNEFIETLDKTEEEKEQLKRAYYFAKKAHAFQRRKSGEPYVSHPLKVTEIVNSFGLDTPSLIASLLHDVVEDTETSLKDIEREFGEEISLLVDGLSKIFYFGEQKNIQDEEKHIETLRKILLASAKDIRILIIKLCDRLHNMRTIGDLKEEKQVRIANETMQIYVPIAQKIGIYALKWELEDLSFKYLNPDMYQFIKHKIKLKREDREEIVEKIVEEVKSKLQLDENSSVKVLGRPKNFYSIYKKIKSKAKSFEDLHDLYAIRIICPTVADCYTLLGQFHEKSQVLPNRLKDYIANPKANGYQSIHTVIVSDYIKGPIEIQIRTEDMNKLAEFGVAAHWKYKNFKEDKKFEQKISWLREVLQWEKENEDNFEFLKLLKFDFFEDEIFIFTPKKDLYTLPEGSCALDLAYAIHTDIGSKAYKAKINGSITSIDSPLKSGDIVEIITNSSVKPSEKWLKFVRTPKARLKIRDQLNLKLAKSKNTVQETSSEELKKKIQRINDYKNVRFAGCCTVEYQDQIVGVLNKEKKLLIHNASCPNAKYSINKKIPLRWEEEKIQEVTLYISFRDRYGVVMDLLTLFSEFNINCTKLNTKVAKDGMVSMSVKIIDGPFVEQMVEKLKQLDSFISVKISRGFFG